MDFSSEAVFVVIKMEILKDFGNLKKSLNPMDKGDEWEDSACLDVYLHRYVITKDWGEMVQEVCDICGDEQFFGIMPDGGSDNMTYLSYHLREALPRNHPQSKFEYANT